MTIFFDKVSIEKTSRVMTDEGFMRVPARVARVGIQTYLEDELLDNGSMKVVKVLRSPEDVFSEDSLATYEASDITDNHPDAMVEAKNYREVVSGHTLGAGRRTGDFVEVDLIVKDAKTIENIVSGKSEVSAGYTADYVKEAGEYNGETYDYKQTNIKINHIAVVDKGRAGEHVKIFDSKRGGANMSRVTLDAKTVIDLEDANKALLVQGTIDALNKRIADAESDAEEAKELAKTADEEKAEAEAKAEKATEDMDEMKEKTSEDSLNARLKSVLATRDRAVAIAGKSFTCDAVDDLTIMREALTVARPAIAWADKEPAYVSAAFDLQEVGSTDAITKDLMTADSTTTLDGRSEYLKRLNGGK